MVSYHPVKFGGHWLCGSGDVANVVILTQMRDFTTATVVGI